MFAPEVTEEVAEESSDVVSVDIEKVISEEE